MTHARSGAIQFDPMHKLTPITLTGAAFLLSTTVKVDASWRCPSYYGAYYPSVGVARIALLIGRVRRLPRSSCHGGAPAKRQDDAERGKPYLPVPAECTNRRADSAPAPDTAYEQPASTKAALLIASLPAIGTLRRRPSSATILTRVPLATQRYDRR
jgi:hypothetical protein